MNVRIGEVVSELALQRAGEGTGEAAAGMQEIDVEDLVEQVVRRVLDRLRREWED